MTDITYEKAIDLLLKLKNSFVDEKVNSATRLMVAELFGACLVKIDKDLKKKEREKMSSELKKVIDYIDDEIKIWECKSCLDDGYYIKGIVHALSSVRIFIGKLEGEK